MKMNSTGTKIYISSRVSITALLSLFFCLASFAQNRGGRSVAVPSVKLSSPQDSLQYTLGAYLGQWITNNGFSVTNSDLFTKGLNDVLLNKTLLVPAIQVTPRLESYQKRLISERNVKQEQLLFQTVKNQSGVGALPNGVNYVIMKAGTGMRPQAADSVLINVKGFLPDGKIFEDTYVKKTPLRGTPVTFIPGLNEVLQIMPVGSIWRIFVPSALAYGTTGVAGLIPAHSAVVYEIELLNAIRNQ